MAKFTFLCVDFLTSRCYSEPVSIYLHAIQTRNSFLYDVKLFGLFLTIFFLALNNYVYSIYIASCVPVFYNNYCLLIL